MASLFIGGNLAGGTGNYNTNAVMSGQVVSSGGIGSVDIMGSVLAGSAGAWSAAINAATGTLYSLNVGGDVVGGAGANSAEIVSSFGDIENVKVGGSLIGGAGSSSGLILSQAGIVNDATIGGIIDAVTIGGDVPGAAV